MTPATLSELKIAMPNAEADFIIRMIEAGADVPTALQHRNAELERAVAAQKASPLAAPAKPAGVTPPKATSGGGSHDDADDFDGLVRAHMTRNPHVSRQQAVLNTAKKYPESYQQFMLDSQPGRQSRRLFAEKMNIEA